MLIAEGAYTAASSIVWIDESGTDLSSKLRIARLDFIASITGLIDTKIPHLLGSLMVYKNDSA
jgi:hypothetical protein